jgi:hypothetical protein
LALEEQLFLVLGCFGRTDDGFISCPGVENRILRIDAALAYYTEITNYFDGLGLFDKTMLDLNAIRHLIYNLQDRYDQKVKRLWNEKQYHLYERFMNTHKPCGIYAKLALVYEELKVPKPEPPQPVFVKGTPERIPLLKVIRGQR